jgi:diguanylate cyclase (GGDEF)-like protein
VTTSGRLPWSHATHWAGRILVLIASQQEWVSRSLETILTPRGYVVRTTFTRAATLAHLQREPPDAVIVDNLPEISAREFCRELREQDVITASTPVLLTLASPATRRDRLAAWRAGAWACLGAPLDADELLAVLDAFLPAKLEADRARTQSLIDDVTGMYNVRGVTKRARELAAQATRRHAAMGCVLLAPDLNGATDGDSQQQQLAQSIAAALRASARTSDAIGRLGPTAFIIIAVDTDGSQAHRLAERLAEAAQPLKFFGGCHGVSNFGTAAIDASELMLRAAAALDRARSEPKGSWLRDFEEVS